jgi:hypothetical protein
VFRPSLWFPVTVGVIFQQNTYVGFIDDEGQFGDWSAFSWVTLRKPLYFEEACFAVHSSQFAEPCRMSHISWMSVCGCAWGCEMNVSLRVGIKHLPHRKPFHISCNRNIQLLFLTHPVVVLRLNRASCTES